jgi:PPOX class probable FMN-dependent enzyme
MIETIDALRHLYGAAKERSVRKQIDHLDVHCRRFVALSPFLVIASGDAEGNLDSSPRGGAPGFVRVVDDRTLLIPDSPGNNRLDTLTNIMATGRVGLLFMIPGVDETLRVNGRAQLNDDKSLLGTFADDRRTPKLVITVGVTDAYLHCAKAFMRSKLWRVDSQVERARLPTMGEMLSEQTGMQSAPETQEQMIARYASDL